MSNLLEMKNISKSFHGVEVLHSVHLEVGKAEIHALCGENGAGKSTMMKILSGIYTQDSGEINFKGEQIPGAVGPLQMQNYGISMIHQELNLVDDLTVAQNIFLCREPLKKNGTIDFKKMNSDTVHLLDKLDEKINPAAKVKELKIAQKQMVEIAKAISFNVELLIMDEPTAVLTGKETEIMFRLMENLRSEGISIIYISHRLREIKDICQKVTVLRDGSYVGTEDVSGLSEKDIAQMMVGREISDERAGNYCGDPEDVILEVNNVRDHFLQDISFKLRRGEILCFSGLVGAGRTELMEVLFGMRTPETGEVVLEGRRLNIRNTNDAISAGIALVSEDRKDTGLVLCRDITENANYVFWRKNRGFFKNRKRTAENTATMIQRLNIKCNDAGQAVANLSGGNQQKVSLAKWLLSDAKILILDEPTRGVDIGARQEIYRIIHELADSGIGIIIVSSDMQEVMGISQRVIVMHEGRTTGELECSELDENKIVYLATNV